MRPSTLSVLAAALAVGLTPDPELDAVAWAQDSVVVPDGPYAGQTWRADIAPYQGEILEVLSPQHPCTRVSVRKAAQTGLTGVGIVWLGLIAKHYPAQTMVVQPTLAALKKFNRKKLQPTIDRSPVLKRTIADQTSRSGKGSSSLHKVFPGGSVTLTIATSSADLRSDTIKFVMCDEVDEYPEDLDGQGDPMGMIDGRQIAFHATGNYKKYEISTPTLKGASRIDEGFEAGDQRHLVTPCPECGEHQQVGFEDLRGNDTWPYEVYWICPANGCVIREHRRGEMIRAARFVATQPGPGRHPSFHVDALLSPVTTWDSVWHAWRQAEGDPHKLKTFNNLWLARSFEVEGEAPAWELLQNRAAAVASHGRGELPASALFLTMGVDVQADRLEAGIWGIGLGKAPIAIDHVVLEGDTNGFEVWTKLTELWQREFEAPNGQVRRIEATAVDSGYRPTQTYDWVRGKPNAISIKGASGRTDWPIGSPKKLSYTPRGKVEKRAVLNWLVGSWYLKAELYGLLNLEGPDESGAFPLGFVHLPTGMDEEWFRQLTAEKLVAVQKRGGAVSYEWQKAAQARNEVLDCGVYARAAAYWLGMGKWSTKQWREMARQRGGEVDEGDLELLRRMHAPVASDDTAEAKSAKADEPPRPAAKGKTNRRRTRSSMMDS